MKIVLKDGDFSSLRPISSTRAVADIRIGILTIKEKWELLLREQVAINSGEGVSIPANIIPTMTNYRQVLQLGETNQYPESIKRLVNPWEISQWNAWAIEEDFKIITKGRESMLPHPSNSIINPSSVFIEPGAVVMHSIINAMEGSVYIGKNAVIMEGNLIRGPFGIGEGSVLKMGSRIYGGTSLGPYCVAGGEIKNSLISGYSNKAHDGYLGDSVIGEWCNLGAGTSNSNVKNSAGTVHYMVNDNKVAAGIKGGLIMGDYSRCAINTSFNTGTIAGVCCNIFGNGFPPKYIPDFSWGDKTYIFERALEDIKNWKKLKDRPLSQNEINNLTSLYHSRISNA